MPIVKNTIETALTDAAESADIDDGADNENFISNVLQKVFMDSKFWLNFILKVSDIDKYGFLGMGSSMRQCLEIVAGIPELEHRCFSIAFNNDYFWSWK